MMTAAQSLAEISRLLEEAMAASRGHDEPYWLIMRAHTHAVIQCAAQRRAEARATFSAFPHLEHGPVQ